MNITLVF